MFTAVTKQRTGMIRRQAHCRFNMSGNSSRLLQQPSFAFSVDIAYHSHRHAGIFDTKFAIYHLEHHELPKGGPCRSFDHDSGCGVHCYAIARFQPKPHFGITDVKPGACQKADGEEYRYTPTRNAKRRCIDHASRMAYLASTGGAGTAGIPSLYQPSTSEVRRCLLYRHQTNAVAADEPSFEPQLRFSSAERSRVHTAPRRTGCAMGFDANARSSVTDRSFATYDDKPHPCRAVTQYQHSAVPLRCSSE